MVRSFGSSGSSSNNNIEDAAQALLFTWETSFKILQLHFQIKVIETQIYAYKLKISVFRYCVQSPIMLSVIASVQKMVGFFLRYPLATALSFFVATSTYVI